MPTAIVDKANQPKALIKDGDAIIIFFNFRADRGRHYQAFVERDFAGFARKKISNLFVASMTEYETGLPIKAAFIKDEIKNTLGETIF